MKKIIKQRKENNKERNETEKKNEINKLHYILKKKGGDRGQKKGVVLECVIVPLFPSPLPSSVSPSLCSSRSMMRRVKPA